MSDNTPASVAAVAAAHDGAITMGFGNIASFEFMQRTAKLFATSTMVPAAYQAVTSKGYGRNLQWIENPAALSNCMIALDIAHRMNAAPLQVMQNLHIIEGRPSWSSSFIIAVINNSGYFAHQLRYQFEWLDPVDATYVAYEWINDIKQEVPTVVHLKRNARCVAWTLDKATGERIESSPITLEMSVQEGWYTRNGSKWRSMPEQMLRYRAASFFGRAYTPELLMGLPTDDEVRDIIDVERQPDGSYAAPAPSPEATAAAAAAAAMAAMDAPKPRPPRAKAEPSDAANVKEVAPVAAVVAAPDAAPAAELAANAGEVVSEEAIAEAKALEHQQRLAKLNVSTAAKATPEPEAQPVTATASAPAGKLLSAPKIAFVKTSLENGGLSSTDLQKKFGVTPDELTDTMFPLVLAWFKDPTK